MAQPKWITPANSLGTISELEYYEFPLDAYDPTGGSLTYTLVSGRLPLGLQIISSGKIQGIPVSELAGDTNVLYRFTIRAKNTDKQVTDRTFSITITNVAPPIINPKNVDLGTFFDGTLINVQLQAIEALPSATLYWKLINGTLPYGLTLTQDGKLTGYLKSNTGPGPGSDPGWDDTAWDLVVPNQYLGWDFPTDLVSQQYTFTIQVDDGVFNDVSTYQLLIFPRQDFIISNTCSAEPSGTAITVDSTMMRSNFDLNDLLITDQQVTVSETNKHQPIILTTQADLIPVKQNSYFAFQFIALDLDDEVLKFAIPTNTGTGFDELNIGYDTTKFSQTELAIPGGEVIRKTTYIASGSSDVIFKVANASELYEGLLITMDSGLGGNRTIVSVLDSNTIILSMAPDNILTDGDPVLFTANSRLTLDENTGWLTGRLPQQTINQVIYDFEVLVYKRDDTNYETRQLFQLTVRGDLNDTVNWITSPNLGTIENGSLSEFYVEAQSTTGKFLYYTLTTNGKKRLPQGLQLTANGLIYGRVSFEVFTLDSGSTTIDDNTTTLDSYYEFEITASNTGSSLSAKQTFTIQVVPRNAVPYENLYLKALPYQSSREHFLSVVNDPTIFNPNLIYRNNDPNFGLAKEIKFLFLPGLEANLLSTYMQGVEFNHCKKRITFGSVKTAVALDTNFSIKYEVVYIEVIDSASNETYGSAANILDLSKLVKHPYYDSTGNSYAIAYPNGFNNMIDSVTETVDYANKGALPSWMTSNQLTSTSFTSPLGLTHAVVLAYTIPGASNKIAYNLNSKKIKFNAIDFTVDRYQLDNNYSKNYNITTNQYLKSIETTFDKLVSTGHFFADKGVVDYAISTPFERLNGMTVTEIQSIGGMDGILDFSDSEHIVFFQQEFQMPFNQYDNGIIDGFPVNYINDYNHGWSNVIDQWDGSPWAYNTNTLDNDNTDYTLDPTPGEPWNYTDYVAGYREHNIDPNIINKRAGIWKINIDNDNFVTLTFVSSVNFYDKVNVRNGLTCGSHTIYLDPTIQPGLHVPTYSLIVQPLNNNKTTFDGNGTRFLTNRDAPVVLGEGDKYIKFAQVNVFT